MIRTEKLAVSFEIHSTSTAVSSFHISSVAPTNSLIVFHNLKESKIPKMNKQFVFSRNSVIFPFSISFVQCIKMSRVFIK